MCSRLFSYALLLGFLGTFNRSKAAFESNIEHVEIHYTDPDARKSRAEFELIAKETPTFKPPEVLKLATSFGS